MANGMATKNSELDQSIDRSLDDVGKFLRRKWWLVLILVVVGWYVVTQIVPVLERARAGNPARLRATGVPGDLSGRDAVRRALLVPGAPAHLLGDAG